VDVENFTVLNTGMHGHMIVRLITRKFKSKKSEPRMFCSNPVITTRGSDNTV
jgi:hypothetical protein